MQKKLLPIIKYLLGWPLSFLALFFIWKTFASDIPQLLTKITHINILFLLLGFLCFLIFYFCRAYLWYILMREKGEGVVYKETSYLWGISQLKRYIPGNIWAFVGLGVHFGEKKITKREIFHGVLVENELVMIIAVWLSLLALPYLATTVFSLPFSAALVMQLLIILFSIGTLVFIYNQKLLPTTGIFSHLQHILPAYAPNTLMQVLGLMLFSYSIYALGYYFIFSSLTFLHPDQLLTYIGLFIVGILGGFLSFITPTGLGVREGLVAGLFGAIIPLSIAGFLSLFTRFVIICAELVYILLSYLWMKIQTNWLTRVERFIASHKHETTLVTVILVYIVFFTTLSFLRHDNFYTGRFDLGNMSQTVWNTAHGRVFEFTNPDGTNLVSRLAFHADGILILLVPFYWLWESPKMLLLIQTIVSGVGAWFVYKLGIKIIKHQSIALAAGIAYLLNPSMQRANLYDFHAVTLATTLFLAAWYFLIQKRYRLFVVFALLAAVTKEQVWFIVGLLGIYTALFYKKYILGLTLAVFSFTMFYTLIWHVIPTVHGQQHFALEYFGEFGSGPSTIVKNIIFSPDKTLAVINTHSRKNYLQQLLLPVGYLPLGAPQYLVFAGPDLTINLLSNNEQFHQIYYQYTAIITPFLFLAALYSIAFILRLFPKLSATWISIYILTFAFYGAYLYGPLPGAKDGNVDMLIKPQKNSTIMINALNAIPHSASVAASNSIGAHLAHRRYLYTLPLGLEEADYVVFSLSDSQMQPSPQVHEQMIADLRTRGNYVVVFEKDDFIIFKKMKTVSF